MVTCPDSSNMPALIEDTRPNNVQQQQRQLDLEFQVRVMRERRQFALFAYVSAYSNNRNQIAEDVD